MNSLSELPQNSVKLNLSLPAGEPKRDLNDSEQMIERFPVPVIPMGLGGLWGSWFSRKEKTGGTYVFPRRLWSKVSLDIGDPVPPQEVQCEQLQLLVRTLRGDRR